MDIGIFVFDGADELDVVGPQRVFAAMEDLGEPVTIHLVAESDADLTLAHGLTIRPTTTFDACPPLDVLVVPGGGSEAPQGRRTQQSNPAAVAFIRDRAAAANVTASVCTGAFLLAEAGILNGRRANTHWRYRDELAAVMRDRGEAIAVVPERVVWDGDDLVTGGGVTSGIDLAVSIIGRLRGATVAKRIEAAIERETPA